MPGLPISQAIAAAAAQVEQSDAKQRRCLRWKYDDTSAATGGSVTLTNADVSYSSGSSASPKGVFGGYAANAAAQNNTVSITGTVASGGYAFANCSIYGGYAGSGTAAGNTVTLTNAKDTSSYGGWGGGGGGGKKHPPPPPPWQAAFSLPPY